MNGNDATYYRYLNQAGRWQGFRHTGLEIGDDGALRLATLPRFLGDPTTLPQAPTAPSGPAGVSLAADGALYWTDPHHSRLLRQDPCDKSIAPTPCIGGPGGCPGQLREPRGLLYHRLRQVLFVADTGNHRLQLFDSATYQLLGIWGQSFTNDAPQPSALVGSFNRPIALADDSDGNVYVVEAGNPRVQKFDIRGTVIPSFWDTIEGHQPFPLHPVGVAVTGAGDQTLVFVLDADGVFVYSSDGTPHPFSDYAGTTQTGFPICEPGSLRGLLPCDQTQPLAIAVGGQDVYIADAKRMRIRKFHRSGAFMGEAPDELAVAGLALDNSGNLIVVDDAGSAPILLSLTGSYVRSGCMWGGPFQDPSGRPYPWHWLRGFFGALPEGAHFQLFFARSTDPACQALGSPPDAATACTLLDLLTPNNVKDCKGKWVQLPLDAPGCLFPGCKSPKTDQDFVWVAAAFSGEGLTTPALSQMRIDFDHNTYLRYLPALYGNDPASSSFLARLLTLVEGQFAAVEARIAGLARLLDPFGTSAEQLDWLGSLLGLEFPEGWKPERKRQNIRNAFAVDASRGTAEGLRRTLWDTLGVPCHIEEPILYTAWWCLPDDSTSGPPQTGDSLLGFTTRLAGVEPQGAVLGSSAVVDQSEIVELSDYGAALFRDVAHRFCVWLYEGYSDPPSQAAVRALLDQEKPAHTAYTIRIVTPTMRVGLQARLGIDAVVADARAPARGAGIVLGGDLPGRIGAASRIGQTTRLGDDPC